MAELKAKLKGWEDKGDVCLSYTTVVQEHVTLEIPDPERPRLREARTQIEIPLEDLASSKWKDSILPLRPGKLTLEVRTVKNLPEGIPLQRDTDLVFLVRSKHAEEAAEMAKEIRFSIMHESLEGMLDDI